MNVVKELQRINAAEVEKGIGGNASWHADFADSAYVYAGGLDYRMTEGDVITIFSQYGEIVDVSLGRDKKTGKSKGFAFVAYENQKSTVLAVDNLNGAKLLGRTLRVDHKANYRPPEEEVDDGMGGDEKVKQQISIADTATAAAEAARAYPHLQKVFSKQHGGSLSKTRADDEQERGGKALDPDELWEKRFKERMAKQMAEEEEELGLGMPTGGKKNKKAKKDKKVEKKKKKELKKEKKKAKKAGKDGKDEAKEEKEDGESSSSDAEEEEEEGKRGAEAEKKGREGERAEEGRKGEEGRKEEGRKGEGEPRRRSRSRSRDRDAAARDRRERGPDRPRERSRERSRDRRDRSRDRGRDRDDRDRRGRDGGRYEDRQRERDRRRDDPRDDRRRD